MPQRAFTALDFHSVSSRSAQANEFHALRHGCKVEVMHSPLPNHWTEKSDQNPLVRRSARVRICSSKARTLPKKAHCHLCPLIASQYRIGDMV